MAGRPLKPIAADAPPQAARIGVEVRRRRLAQGLTLAELGSRAGYSPQHLSSLELATGTVTRQCLAAIDAALGADGVLLEHLPALVCERALANHARAAARRYDEGVDPLNRRGLLGASAVTALGAAGAVAVPVPGAAREVDPALPRHWTALLELLGDYDDAHGPHEVLGIARRELRLIAEHRQVARGELRTALMNVEASWAVFAAWVAHDADDVRSRDALLDHALHLAREADSPDLIAWARARQAQWSDAPRAIGFAEAGLRTRRSGAHTRAMCAVRAAHAHARLGKAEPAVRSIAQAETLLAQDSLPLPPPGPGMSELLIRRWEARCWAELEPARGVTLYDDIMRGWPRGWTRDGGLYLAYLASACAGAGELDRARAEGRKALAIVRQTQSATAARELKRLGAALSPA